MVEGGIDEFGSDCVGVVSMMWMNDEIERPRFISTGELAVCDGMVVSEFGADQRGESLATSLAKIEPEMVAQRTHSVCAFGISEKLGHFRDVVCVHVSLDGE